MSIAYKVSYFGNVGQENEVYLFNFAIIVIYCIPSYYLSITKYQVYFYIV